MVTLIILKKGRSPPVARPIGILAALVCTIEFLTSFDESHMSAAINYSMLHCFCNYYQKSLSSVLVLEAVKYKKRFQLFMLCFHEWIDCCRIFLSNAMFGRLPHINFGFQVMKVCVLFFLNCWCCGYLLCKANVSNYVSCHSAFLFGKRVSRVW